MIREQQRPQKIEGRPGQNIRDFAQELIYKAKRGKRVVTGTFNEIDLVVDPRLNLSVDQVVATFLSEMNKKREAYNNSSEGIKAREEYEEKKQIMQEKALELIEQLNTLDFSDYELVLEWICNFQKISNAVEISYDRHKIISIFKDHGFGIIDVIMEKNLDTENAENFARYLIGVGLDEIKTIGHSRGMVQVFTIDWKKKFGRQKQEDEERIKKIKKTL